MNIAQCRLVALLGITIIAFHTTVLSAQNFTPSTHREIILSLDETTRLALENNFDIQLAKYDAWIARSKKGGATSIYDTILRGEARYHNDQSAKPSTILGTKVINNDYNLGLTQKSPTGTKLDVDIMNNRNASNSIFSISPVTHESTAELTVSQDMGKNFFGIKDRGLIKITQQEIVSSEYSSLDRIEKNLAVVQKAYWDLVLDIEKAAIEKEIVEQARKFYEFNREKLKDGLLEKPEVLASEANYKRGLNELSLAQNQVQTKGDILKLLLNIDDNQADIVPKESLSLVENQIQLDEALKSAFEHRRDYKAALSDVKAKEIQLAIDRNNFWPEINLKASFARNGLGDHFKQAVNQISQEDNPDFSAGLSFSFPLFNSSAKSQFKKAELEKAKIILASKWLERKIVIGVSDQVRDCQIYHELAVNDQEVSNLQSQKFDEEMKRFQSGRSNTDTIIRFQGDVLEAKSAAAESKYRYAASLIDLMEKKGTLLEQYWDEKL